MKATGIVRRIDDLGRVSRSKRNQKNTEDQGRRPTGDIHGQGRRDYPEEIFSDRRIIGIRQTVCRKSVADAGMSGRNL